MTLDLLHKRCGFTVIELVVIMVLIGILSAVVLPRVLNPSSYRTRAYFDELVSATRYAQQLALASGCEARISIASGSFNLQQRQCGSGTWQMVTLPGNSPPYTAPPGVSASSATITFTGSGQAGLNQDVSVGIYTLRVHAATGYVERL